MNVLVIAPHRDDEVIGVGGTIAKYVANGDDVYICAITHGEEPLFHEASDLRTKRECLEAHRILGVKETIFLDFPAVMLETVPRSELNAAIFNVVQRIKPDIVYIPHRGDMQQDHKITVDAAMVALRPKYEHKIKKIYVYETLSETGWDLPNVVNEFIPTAYSDITEYLDTKIQAMKAFASQLSDYPNPRSIQAIVALAQYRGSNMNISAAEAFTVIRDIF